MHVWCRPDYKKLGVLKQQFPEVPTLALTATATDLVCQSIKEILRISACEFFCSSVDRSNLFWSVSIICAFFARHIPIRSINMNALRGSSRIWINSWIPSQQKFKGL